MATTICMLNQKGGCGKSTTCFHLAGALASSGRNVLLVDVDPQGSLSQGFLGSTAVENLSREQTVATVFDNGTWCTSANVIRETSFPGIRLLATNRQLSSCDLPQVSVGGLKQFALREFLQAVNNFDVVLIDCPPNLYECSWAALLAADAIIIPVPPEDFCTQGLIAVHQAIESARRLNPALSLLGHLITRRDQRLVIHRMYEERIRLLYKDSVFSTVVPEAVAFKVAVTTRSPVEYDQPNSAAAEVMRQLVTECFERIHVNAISTNLRRTTA